MRRVLLAILLFALASLLGCTQADDNYEARVAPDGKVVAPPPDEFTGFETYLDTMLNQGHGVGYDVYDPAVERFRKFEASGITDEDLERVRQKLQRLNPEAEGSQETQSKPSQTTTDSHITTMKTGLLSPRGCEGTGSFMLGASPLAPDDIEKIRPMGGLTSVHITPTDHQYWDTIESDGMSDDKTNLDRFKVYAPADGFIVDIEQHTDYRVVIEHSCTFYAIFIHVDKLSDKIMAAAGLKESEVGNHAWPRIPVGEGEVIGSVGVGKLDFSVVDGNVTLTGFVNPESYEGEPWKIHTVDTFDYYEEPLRSRLIAKNVRTASPPGGKIDYDVEGRLVGNWFRQGTGKYKGNLGEYWTNHLSIVYDSIDPSQARISVGNFDGRGAQFGVKGNQPDPATVDGLVKYELTTFDYYAGDTKWNPAKFSNNIQAKNLDEVRGVALFKVLPENKLQAEFFPGKKAAEVAEFTASAIVYER